MKEIASGLHAQVDRDLGFATWEPSLNVAPGYGTDGLHERGYGLGLFTLGDFMGFIEEVPEGMAEVDADLLRSLIPDFCR